MKAKRRLIRHVADLESMTDKELRAVYFFGTHPSYPVVPEDGPRARAILLARGYFQRTPDA